MDVCDLAGQSGRAWVNEAIRRVTADTNRSADTHLIPLVLPSHWGEWGIDVYLKDESTHPTGSLKHRLARSLFLYALCNGWIREGATIVEASSGSTAVSEAYFARMLGLPFVAVIPAGTSPEKIDLIEFAGGRCHLVDDPARVYDEAARSPRRPAATSWTSSPTPSGPPTGAATTTSPSRSSSSSPSSGIRSRNGSWSAPGRAAPRRPSAGSSATAATRPGSASWTRRTPPSS